MPSKYSVLKGTVSQLQVFDDDKEIRSDHIGLIALIGLAIVGLIGAAGALIGSLTNGGFKLEGQHFICYVGSKKVEGCLARAGFNDGDYVEMVVKQQRNDIYRAYTVRIPQQHILFFPQYVGSTTLVLLKNYSIVAGCLSLFSLAGLSFMAFLSGSLASEFIELLEINLILFTLFLFIFFFMLGGRYSFLSNKIYAILGYPKPWLFDRVKEDEKFKKMNRSGDPELFDDPQTPDFQKLTKYTPLSSYYCRTPTIPDWVNIIDEREEIPEIEETH